MQIRRRRADVLRRIQMQSLSCFAAQNYIPWKSLFWGVCGKEHDGAQRPRLGFLWPPLLHPITLAAGCSRGFGKHFQAFYRCCLLVTGNGVAIPDSIIRVCECSQYIHAALSVFYFIFLIYVCVYIRQSVFHMLRRTEILGPRSFFSLFFSPTLLLLSGIPRHLRDRN